jgi:dethiobiotin synthetase
MINAQTHQEKFAWFITGTDTDIGKTLVAGAMLRALTKMSIRNAGMKPVAAGATLSDGVWHNDDVDTLASEASVVLPQELATPFLLRQPTAPHIAADQEKRTIEISHILACYRRLAEQVDALVVEGVGGFCVPLNDREDTADLAQRLALPVVLVVGLRLGCINHALLTVEAIASRGLSLAGWVANTVDDQMLNCAANIAALNDRINAPLLGHVPRIKGLSGKELITAVVSHLNFSSLLGWPEFRGLTLK